MMIRNLLFKKELNSPLVIFRIFFGLLMIAESFGAVYTGWVKATFIAPEFTFTFFGFEWTHFLLGKTMYVFYIAMGLLSVCILIGYRYRLTAFSLALLWSLSYFMQKESYNNHYYLIVLLSWFMFIVPAHRFYSLDVFYGRVKEKRTTWRIYRYFFILQLFIVYTFAAIAKLYPGWMSGDFLSIRLRQSAFWFEQKFGLSAFADFLNREELHVFMSYSGFYYDLLLIPLLLIKQTRWVAIIASLVFHLFNSLLLHIGIFPYLAISMAIFFFSPQLIDQFFFRKNIAEPFKQYYGVTTIKMKLASALFIVYFLWQIYLPIRHFFIEQDVLWTEEGHRLSWRMMLRSKSGYINFTIVNPENGKVERVNQRKYMTNKQRLLIATKPDMIWAFSQRLKKEYAENGKPFIEIYARGSVSINGGRRMPFVNPDIDLACEKWNYFGHQRWLLPMPEE